MVRRKVKIQFIENLTARRVTYRKRLKCLMKKTEELSTLCGIDACTIVYGPFEYAPVVYPENEAEAKRIIMEYMHMPQNQQSQRQLNQESYMRQRVAKAREQLEKLQRRNREMEMEILMSQLLSGKKPVNEIAPSDMNDLLKVIDDKLELIQHRIHELKSID